MVCQGVRLFGTNINSIIIKYGTRCDAKIQCFAAIWNCAGSARASGVFFLPTARLAGLTGTCFGLRSVWLGLAWLGLFLFSCFGDFVSFFSCIFPSQNACFCFLLAVPPPEMRSSKKNF